MGKKNENCPIGRVITTEEECTEASWQLGIKYENELKKVDYPVGCHTKSDGSSYLNIQLHSSASAQENFKNRLPVCWKGTKIYFFVDLFSDFIIKHIVNSIFKSHSILPSNTTHPHLRYLVGQNAEFC